MCKKLITFLLLVTLTDSLYALGLIKSIDDTFEKWDDLTKVDRDAGYYPIAVVETTREGIVYTYDGTVGETDYISGELLRGWSFDPWSSHLFLAGEYSSGAERIAGAHGENFKNHSSPIDKVLSRPASYSYDRTKKGRNEVGCFQNHPLRYGDLDDNGTDELVLMLGQNIVMFSSEIEKIVFSAHYWLADEIPVDEEDRYFPWDKKPVDPQYIAYSGTDVALNEVFPARRSLSKLFFGSFEDESKQDIVLWRKLYESKLRNDPEQGFDLFGETWVHYRMVNGVYQLQETAPEVLEDWLASNELTWMDGVPSVSECEGQEGQLIPELHDPILNDPEILN